MQVVEDDDQLVGLAAQVRRSRLQVDDVGLYRESAPRRLGAERVDRMGIAVDRPHRPAALGQEEGVPAAAAGYVEGAAGAGYQIDVGEEPGRDGSFRHAPA